MNKLGVVLNKFPLHSHRTFKDFLSFACHEHFSYHNPLGRTITDLQSKICTDQGVTSISFDTLFHVHLECTQLRLGLYNSICCLYSHDTSYAFHREDLTFLGLINWKHFRQSQHNTVAQTEKYLLLL